MDDWQEILKEEIQIMHSLLAGLEVALLKEPDTKRAWQYLKPLRDITFEAFKNLQIRQEQRVKLGSKIINLAFDGE